MRKTKIDKLNRGLEIRHDRLNRLKIINANMTLPDEYIQNELNMIDELNRKLKIEVKKVRKLKLQKLNETDKGND